MYGTIFWYTIRIEMVKLGLNFDIPNGNRSLQMRNSNGLHNQAMDMLMKTSRTFYIPIRRLPPVLQESVASAYLCMRAIDEIEDHPELTREEKVHLLRSISQRLQMPVHDNNLTYDFTTMFQPYTTILEEVTLAIDDWIQFCPPVILPSVLSTTATMAEGMAEWVENGWDVQTVDDLNRYTLTVAGIVGILLSDIWQWHEALETDRTLAVGFGRGLQAVNIIRNRKEDLARGVDFFPFGWQVSDMFVYARKQLKLARAYLKSLKHGPILDFCKLPLVFAYSTLTAMENGEPKLSRSAVEALTQDVLAENAALPRYDCTFLQDLHDPETDKIADNSILFE
jgi:farnesyl-diphosphate farnesyltransferase